ncbi:MAG: hypothetical protein N2561_08155 [Bacteroidetes bacterium]|nr:hypothetical protein [Rhodothermia bacterium]MCS7155420.1 hypothetical protein [Bacteroidota bacterium]MCX7907487.1 hypothetical protein [Bacteroidota bacterium]MDW8138481.1 hypothetical protein [Bacteroidota bacterium]MDW8284582.1 hypothetical protein [Bacteroidota bacterium]
MRWLLASLCLAGCVAPLPPPFRDFQAPASWRPEQLAVLQEALREAGWEPRPGPVVHSLSTHPRRIAGALLYRVEGYVELVAIDSQRVRLYVHAYRYHLWGRSRIGYLSAALSRNVAEPIERALRRRGFVLTPYELKPITIE